MKKADVIREVMSLEGCGYQVAKRIVQIAAGEPDVFRMVGASRGRRPMCGAEAARIVEAARTRIALVDEPD